MQTTLAAPPARRLLASTETAEGTVTLSVCASARNASPRSAPIDLRTARSVAAGMIAAARQAAEQTLRPIATRDAAAPAPAWDGVERRSGLEDARLVIVERRQAGRA